MKTRSFFTVILILAGATTCALADTVNYMAFRGFATDAGGTPIASGNLAIRVYDAATDPSDLLYDSGTDFEGVIASGRFDVILGSGVPLSLDDTIEYFMEIDINGETVVGTGSYWDRYRFWPLPSGSSTHQHDDLYYRKGDTVYDPYGQISTSSSSVTIDDDLYVNGDAHLNGNKMIGALNCLNLFVECNGECTDEPSPYTICQEHMTSSNLYKYVPVAVSCLNVANWGDQGQCPGTGDGECAGGISFQMPLGSFCDDGSGWDALITCCRYKD